MFGGLAFMHEIVRKCNVCKLVTAWFMAINRIVVLAQERSFLLHFPCPQISAVLNAAKIPSKTFWDLRRFCYTKIMILGYVRVSTQYQNLDAQLDALKAIGVEKIFKEKITGKTKNRPQLEKLLEQLREDDVVIATKYDRLA